jgi:putative tricarboxylic transport membrane protein
MRPAEAALSAGVLALGIAAALVTATLPSEGGYAGIGPNFIPAIVAAGLIALGLWLSYEALAGAWRNMPPHEAALMKKPFAWVSAALFLHMALIAWAGFVVAGTVLFAMVARGFGSARLARDVAVGVLLTSAIYLFFVKLLNVALPAGWMRWIA